MLFLPVVPIKGDLYPTLAVKIIYEDPDYIIEHDLSNVTISAQNMTSTQFVLNFTFPKPEIISTLGYGPDQLKV